ncbi:MAG: tetraacyldisaccharide 4'-kinase [Fimbriimonadaceae bacterium]|nr:tetraacyldisaccharide 4'-kinase [Fimbriimonadaceae bacterium]QYK56043.1 MAG: tetraacyldisaccharide 4'-kinase [Fimbriimonadaceae bacterium]
MRIDMESTWAPGSPAPYLLSPLALLYALGWWSYEGLYALGLKKPFEPHRPVVSVGNLLVGGSGKTPLTLFVSSVLTRLGKAPVLSLSGYGAARAKSASIAPEGPLDPAEWGDEPTMVRWLRPELPLVVGRDRVQAARLVHERWPDRSMLMDDGFQHLRLRQHVPIVIDARAPNRFCLPAGPYREPRWTGLKRARLVLPSKDMALRLRPVWLSPEGEAVAGPKGDAQAVCALARPYRLVSNLEAQGIKVRRATFRPDHDPLTAPGLLESFDPNLPTVVTAKDWVKLRERPDVERLDVRVAHYELMVEPEAAFLDWLGGTL